MERGGYRLALVERERILAMVWMPNQRHQTVVTVC